MQDQQQNKNRLDFYRRRMHFSTPYVAHLLGHQNTSAFREFERGERLPSLASAFRLGIILRVPVEFLFPDLYDGLKNAIRSEEERMAQPRQQPLF
jgi:transcriptional regulator with XRE-family HTH domain